MLNRYLRRLLPLALFVLPVNAFADPLSVFKAGNGSFVLHGNDLSNVAVIDAVISYDPSSLANPRLLQGPLASGAMTAANVTVPGTVKVSLIGNGIQGSGPLITLVFDETGSTPGAITDVTGTITNSRGEKTQVALHLSDPSTPTAPPVGGDATLATTETTPAPSEGAAAVQGAAVATAEPGGARVLGGTVALPGDNGAAAEMGDTQKLEELVQPEQREERGSAVEAQNPSQQAEPQKQDSAKRPPQPVEEPVQQAEVVRSAQEQSVLERFRQYKGERTVKALTALFDKDNHLAFVQEPAVVVADGKRRVKVSVPNVTGATAPNFAFDGARAGSVTLERDAWVIEVIPEKGALQARITMLQQGKMQELPLTVTPAADIDLKKSGKVTEEDFRLYLKGTGTAGAAKFDLNGDGKRDYLDDYIFTANYLAYLGSSEQKEVAARQGVAKAISAK